MNKEQSADDPPWIWFVKNMLNSTISKSYPDVVIAWQKYKVSQSIRAIEAALVKYDMKDYSLVADWSPYC